MTQEKWNTYLHTWKSKIFTARNAKIAVTAIVICAVAGSGGAWYHHQQKQAYKEKKIQAMSQMIEAQAQAQNLTLIPEEKARALAAQAIGKDESSLSFSRISLIDLEGSKHEKGEDRHKEKDKKDKKDRDKKQDREKAPPLTPGLHRTSSLQQLHRLHQPPRLPRRSILSIRSVLPMATSTTTSL